MTSKIFVPTSANITISVGNKVLGVVQSYKVLATKSSKPILAFGQHTPVATIGGAEEYVLELSRIYATETAEEERVDFFDLDDFTVTVKKKESTVCYSNCRWIRAEEGAEVGGPVLEKVTLTAGTRKDLGKDEEEA